METIHLHPRIPGGIMKTSHTTAAVRTISAHE
jgi:hypothetical protein